MAKVKVSELSKPAINWLVAKLEGYSVGIMTAQDVIQRQLEGESDPEQIDWIHKTFSDFETVPCFVSDDGYKSQYSSKLANRGIAGKINFCDDWSQGGPIMERERIKSRYSGPLLEWECWLGDCGYSIGPTPLTAAMRCYITSRCGELVEIPDELMGGESV